jgi:hypothetical protein
MKYSYAHILQANYPREKWEIKDRTYEGIVWLSEKTPKPEKEWLDKLAEKMEKVEDRLEKKRDLVRSNVSQAESYCLLDAEQEAELALSRIKEIHAAYKKKLVESLIELKKLEEIKSSARAETYYFEELSQIELAQKEEAAQYLRDTDWLVIRELETGKEIPESIKIKRQAARVMVEKGEKVYKNYDSLQREELPSIEERIAAIKAGGERLKQLKSKVEKAQKIYKKPRRRIDS